LRLGEEERQIRFSFPPAPDSGRDVLTVEHLCKSFDDNNIFNKVSLQFQRGDKVAVVGVNGAGKTTLVKIIAGDIAADSGVVKLGHNVQLSYFGQHQAQELDPSLTALETLSLSVKDMTHLPEFVLCSEPFFFGEKRWIKRFRCSQVVKKVAWH